MIKEKRLKAFLKKHKNTLYDGTQISCNKEIYKNSAAIQFNYLSYLELSNTHGIHFKKGDVIGNLN